MPALNTPATSRPLQPPLRTMPVSPTLAADDTIARRRREGLPILPLGFGEAGIPIHPSLTAALAAAAPDGAYGPVAGSAGLRDAVAGYWTRRGLTTDPDMIVAGPGSKALLFGLLMCLTDGDVAIPSPSWVSYAAQATLTGANAVHIATPPGEGGVPSPALLADAAVRARAAGRTIRAVVVTLPDNPTGTLASEATVRKLCDVARDHDLLIISDEIYRDLVHDPAREVPSPAAFAPERTVTTTALSKHLAAGGWRLGVARLPDGPFGHALRAGLLGVASEIWSSAPAPIQHAAAYAFAEPPELLAHIDKSRRLHAAVATAVADRFTQAGARVRTPQAAFYVYPDFAPLREPLGLTTGAALCAHLLERYGMSVLPASAFGESPETLRVRVAPTRLYGTTDDQRLTALESEAPTTLPWVAAGLDHLSEVLTDLTATPQPAPPEGAPTPAPAAVA